MPNRTLCVVFLLLALFLPQVADLNAAEVIIRSDEQLRLAEEAMGKGEHQRAVVELERFLHFFPDHEKVARVRYLIGVCYLKGKAYEKARDALGQVIKTYPGSPIAGDALFMIGESYYRQGLPQEAEKIFQQVMAEYPEPEMKNRAIYRIGWCRMKTDRWKQASESFGAVDPGSPLHANAYLLSQKSLHGETLPSKDPTTAGVMAGLLPGLGHAYCERYKDGLVALVLNGLFIWATYEAFDQDHDVLGGILAFLELGWYSGNIYSAVNCAHKYNRAKKNDFLRNLKDETDLHLLVTDQGHVGLALQTRF
ncbi:MAG: tetratricopeptide repeat protein [Deltaproteobacteria bacterium]|nr:tetratricopeptide repeat protein [Deltaproteobacteria bacterium]